MLSTNTDTSNLTFGTFNVCVHDAVSRRRSSAMKPARRRESGLSAFVVFILLPLSASKEVEKWTQFFSCEAGH